MNPLKQLIEDFVMEEYLKNPKGDLIFYITKEDHAKFQNTLAENFILATDINYNEPDTLTDVFKYGIAGITVFMVIAEKTNERLGEILE